MKIMNRPTLFSRPVGALALTAAMLILAAPSARAAGIEGISYTLTPSAEAIRWDNDLGIEDTELWGGRLGINFGRYVTLEGFYLTRDNINTEVAGQGLLDDTMSPVVDQELNLRNYGTEVVVNLAQGKVVPFVKAGGGVLRFETADGDKSDQVNLRYGAGLRFGLDRLRASVWVEDSAFRLNRYDLVADAAGVPTFPDDPEAGDLRHNLTVGAGVDFALGGYSGAEMTETDRAVASRLQGGLGGLSVPIEPFAGTIRYDDQVGLSSQELVGVRTGLDFGRYFGLRGYYWQGINHDFKESDPIRSYGGEAQFNLNAGQGGIPYLLVGAGQLDFRPGFRDGSGAEREDRTMLILGGGVQFTVGKRVRLDVSIRDYLFSDANLEDVSSTDQLTNNIVLAAGARFSLGGSSGGGARPDVMAPAPLGMDAPAEPSTTVAQADSAAATAQATPAPVETAAGTPPPTTPAPTVVAVSDSAKTPASTPDATTPAATAPVPVASAPAADAPAPATMNFHGDRVVTIPVPVQGEIYVRYGTPGGVQIQSEFKSQETLPAPVAGPAPAPATPGAAAAPAPAADTTAAPAAPTAPAVRTSGLTDEEMIRSIIRQELDAARAAAPAPAAAAPAPTAAAPAETGRMTSAQELELLERRLSERIDTVLDTRLQKLETRPADSPTTIVLADGTPAPATQVVRQVEAPAESFAWRPSGAQIYTGVNLDDPTQFLAGLRLDLGPLRPESKLHFVPEIGLGFGDDTTSFLAAANLRWDFRPVEEKGAWTPFVYVGGGILGFTNDVADRTSQEGVLNLGYGVTANFGSGTAFIEHQAVDLFDLNRFLTGVQWGLGS